MTTDLTVKELSKWLAVQYKDTQLSDLIDECMKVIDSYLYQIIIQYLKVNTLNGFKDLKAHGYWLDLLGKRIDEERPLYQPAADIFSFETENPPQIGTPFSQGVFQPDFQTSIGISDEYFVKFLLMRYFEKIWVRDIESYRNALLVVFDDALVIDNENMTYSLSITTEIPLGILRYLKDAGIFPHISGVRLDTISVIDPNVKYFSFAPEHSTMEENGVGFDGWGEPSPVGIFVPVLR